MMDVVGHSIPILKSEKEEKHEAAPCYARRGKQWELIKARADSGETIPEIAEAMGLEEKTVIFAAHNHDFPVKNAQGKYINASSLAAKIIKSHTEPKPPKPPVKEKEESWESIRHKGAAAANRLEQAARENIIRVDNDPVNHPSHYCDGKIEVIDFIEDKKLGYHLGNAIKYIARAGKKDPTKLVEDLRKAIWYINRRIEEEGEHGRD